jgi:uncharacterized protein YndB with AHSA1/START domain
VSEYARFEKTFSLSVPAGRAWQAFTDPKDLEVWLPGKIDRTDVAPGGRITWEGGEYGQELAWDIVSADPPNSLVFRESGILAGETEVTVTFEQADTGTRVTVTQAGFGDDEDWQHHLESAGHSWGQTLAALDLYLRTGARYDRFFTFRSGLGMLTKDELAGPVVHSVGADSFAANAGLQPGDIILKLGAAPVFSYADLWLFTREHAAGEQVEVTFVHDREVRTATAALTEPA